MSESPKPKNNITFPGGYSFEHFFTRGCISFPADVDGRRLTCLVGVETLQSRFGLQDPRDGKEVERLFLTHLKEIRDAAKWRIERGLIQEGEVLVHL
jgi:hypothetical protein